MREKEYEKVVNIFFFFKKEREGQKEEIVSNGQTEWNCSLKAE